MDKVKVVKIDTNPAKKSVKDLRQELKDLKDELVNLDQGTKEYSETVQKAADIQHTLKDMTDEINASAMDTGQVLSNVTKSFQGMVGAITAVTGLMNLFGDSNEDVQKAVKTLTSLIAVVQGLAAIDNGIKAFKRLGLVIKTTAVYQALFNKESTIGTAAAKASAIANNLAATATSKLGLSTNAATIATKAFRAALISTGIGAIAVAVGVLVANLDKLTAMFKKTKESSLGFSEALASITTLNNQFGVMANNQKSMFDSEYAELKRNYDLLVAKGATSKELHDAELKLIQKELGLNKNLSAIYSAQAKTHKESVNNLMESGHAVSDLASAEKELTYYTNMNVKLEYAKAKYLEDNNETEAKSYDRNINLNKQRVEALKVYIESLKNLNGVNESISNLQTKQQISEIQYTKELAKAKAEDLKRQISINEAKQTDYKWSKDGYTAYINYYNEISKLYTEDSKEYKDNQAEKTKYVIEFAKQAKLSQEEIDKQLRSSLTLEEQLNIALEDRKHAYDKEIQSKKYSVEQLKQLEEVYLQDVIEIRAKYNKQISERNLKELEIEQKNQKNLYSRMLTDIQENLRNEETAINRSFANREIKESEYYATIYNTQKLALQRQKELTEEAFNNDMMNVDSQINNLENQLKINGLDETTITAIKDKIAELNLYKVEAETEKNNTIAELNRNLVDTEIDEQQRLLNDWIGAWEQMRSVVNGAMQDIINTGDGVSSQWITALDKVNLGFENLAASIKAGGAGWSDYAQMATAALSAIGSVMLAIADQQDSDTKEGFEKQKKFQVAAATMNMLGGILSAWVSAMNPANAWMTIWGQIAAGAAQSAAIAALGGVQISKIKQQQFGGSTSGSLNSGAMNSLVQPTVFTQDVQGASFEDALKDQRVYITESDITNTQKKVDVAQSEASF